MWANISFASFQLATIEVAPQKIPFSRRNSPRVKISFTWIRKAIVGHQRAELVKEEDGAEATYRAGPTRAPICSR